MRVADLTEGCLLTPRERLAFRLTRFIDKGNLAPALLIWRSNFVRVGGIGVGNILTQGDVLAYIETVKLAHPVDGCKTWHLFLFGGKLCKLHGSFLRYFDKY